MSVRGRDVFAKYRPVLVAVAGLFRALPLRRRIGLFERVRMLQGRLGLGLRYCLLKSICPRCGDNVSVHPGAYVLSPERLVLGHNVSIHPMTYIEAGGEVSIGSDVSVAHGATILSTSHQCGDLSTPVKDQPLQVAPTTIEDDAWIGAKSTILMGVTVHSGSVVGAGAVVTRDVPPNSVVAGVPARVIATRS